MIWEKLQKKSQNDQICNFHVNPSFVLKDITSINNFIKKYKTFMRICPSYLLKDNIFIKHLQELYLLCLCLKYKISD